MLLIFGGTTEGRMAVDVCEQGAATFYYSTKGDSQQVTLHHGVRITGAMRADDIRRFCHEHDIRLIVDAAHPFAEGLHRAVADAGLPVVRLEVRNDNVNDSKLSIANYPLSIAPKAPSLIKCSDFDDAVRRLCHDRPKRLLALTGVNSLSRLAAYWRGGGDMVARILRREESLQKALSEGFPEEKLVYYEPEHTLPTVEEERGLMERVGCDAIITKQSGDEGGFPAKVEAAQALGLKIYVVKPPSLPAEWTYVTGRHTLRRAIERLVPGFFLLATGLTTGTCATAAVKAALLSLSAATDITAVSVELPDGEEVEVPVSIRARGVAAVIKDESDDPDVTRGCTIVAQVATRETTGGERGVIRFLQGAGVGRVTLPGLGIPVGGPAINATPRRMIEHEVRAITPDDIDITISVEGGEELARHTFNPRVGVVDGISIIGTSGIVHPLSHEAFVESIGRELEVAKALGQTAIGLATGKAGEDTLYRYEEGLRVVLCGNLIGEALARAHALGFGRVILAIGIGKAVKLAEGHLDTHSHKVVMNKEFISQVARETAGDEAAEAVAHITLARELWDVMPEAFFERMRQLCLAQCRTAFGAGELEMIWVK
ncbi:MAG: cobalt-precorrin-5B (C(1))-methyltransferase CbiD [Bacteroidaceae bacterium]|nr:cobalt-precorrin-5B (C(1))-methyltransferase CbiD [Bacteroidaceae bacterium]